MLINQKLLKPIDETKYLTAENAWRYRTILRFLYLQYEKMKYWMYKEEVFEELKSHDEFANYTIDNLKQDLDVLVSWKNLSPIQDTSKVSTVEEFKNKQFRYQLSDYSVEIERMTIKLENIFVENASLEPSLLERLREELEKFSKMIHEDERLVGSWWRDLNDDFKRLNQNYQDYMGDFYSLRAEEMMKTREFLVYKDRFVDYLRDFIKSLQQNVNIIESILKKITEHDERVVLEKIYSHEISIPRLDGYDDNDLILENIKGKWRSIKEWFLEDNYRESEASRLFDITNEIIRKITRFAAHISESRNSAANRKEEYKKLAQIFLACEDIGDAHKLSALSFGIFSPKHIRGDFERKTDSINSGIYEEGAYAYTIKPRSRNYREKGIKTPIASNEERKKQMLNTIMERRQEEKELMESYIQDGIISFASLPIIEPKVRTTLLRWLTKGLADKDHIGKTEYGREFKVLLAQEDKRCKLICQDGQIEMPAFQLVFKEDLA
ncbi:TIGR02677 family protein [Tissierella creatinini]|nr:TIGR02677 family protein [Tissierella creatinini]TJX63107.1 TIGR02677 family protein [Soehngenia saccharolytica]